jgi:hypothetical protein
MKWWLLLLLLACNSGPDEFDGIGKWRFNHSTRKDAKEGRCDPTKLSDGREATWCYANTPLKIAGRAANVDLYFLGTDPDGPLIEIQLQIRGCVEDDLIGWMRTSFGEQILQKPKKYYWQNKYLFAAAFAPSEPGRCEVHFLPLSEQSEIARLKGEAAAPR